MKGKLLIRVGSGIYHSCGGGYLSARLVLHHRPGRTMLITFLLVREMSLQLHTSNEYETA